MRKPQFSLGFLTICISRDLKFARFGGVAFADIKFITFRVKLKICDSSKSLTFPKEKRRFLHFGGYRGVKNDVGCFGRRQKTPPSKSPTLFLLWKCLIFLRKNNVFWIEQTSLRTFAQRANVLKDVCSISRFFVLHRSLYVVQKNLVFLRKIAIFKDVH